MEDKIKKRAEAIGKEPAYPNYSNINDVGTEGMTKFELFAKDFMSARITLGKDQNRDNLVHQAISDAQAVCYALAQIELKEVSNG